MNQEDGRRLHHRSGKHLPDLDQGCTTYLSIHKYDQAYHDKWKKQQGNHDKGCVSSQNEDCSTTGNVPNIVEMSFPQMEGQHYKCGVKGHLSNTCTKNVTKVQWYMDKMKTQDTQLMQASGETMSTVDDQSLVTGTTPATNGTNSQGTASQEANRPSWQGLQVHKSGTIHTTAMCKPTSTCMIGSSSIHVHQSISFVINPLCAMHTKSILHYPSQ